MAWLRGLLFGLQLLVLFLGSLPSPADCADVAKLAPPPQSPPPAPKPPRPAFNVSVEGVVYCRCKLPGYIEPKDASPLPGALVNLKCGKVDVSVKTDAKGCFLLDPNFPSEKVSKRFVARSCKVYVLSTPLPACTVPEFLGPKGKGASVVYEKSLVTKSGDVEFFTAQLELGPAKSTMCRI